MVTNKTQKLVVTDGTQGTALDALAPGEFLVKTTAGAVNQPLELKDEFQIAVGKLNGSLNISDRIKAKDITNVSLQRYRAKAEQVVSITLTAPVDGLDYNLSIINKSDKEILQRRQDKRSYSYRGTTGATANDMAVYLQSLINADEGSAVVATVSAAVLTLTAKDVANKADAAGLYAFQHYFDAFLYEVTSDGVYKSFGTIVNTTPVDFGSGSYAQVKTIEKTAQGYEGYLNRRQFPVVEYPSDLLANKNYDLLTIEYTNHYFSNSVSWGEVNDPIVVVVAVEAGNTTDLEAIFVDFL